MNEFLKTGGLLQTKEGSNACPFITENLEYLTNTKSFIWSQSNKYDIIVRYTVQAGTSDYLNKVSVPGSGMNSKTAASSNLVIKKLETYTISGGTRLENYNFGFPGAAGSIHFNPKVEKLDVIDMSTKGVKGQ